MHSHNEKRVREALAQAAREYEKHKEEDKKAFSDSHRKHFGFDSGPTIAPTPATTPQDSDDALFAPPLDSRPLQRSGAITFLHTEFYKDPEISSTTRLQAPTDHGMSHDNPCPVYEFCLPLTETLFIGLEAAEEASYQLPAPKFIPYADDPKFTLDPVLYEDYKKYHLSDEESGLSKHDGTVGTPYVHAYASSK